MRIDLHILVYPRSGTQHPPEFAAPTSGAEKYQDEQMMKGHQILEGGSISMDLVKSYVEFEMYATGVTIPLKLERLDNSHSRVRISLASTGLNINCTV